MKPLRIVVPVVFLLPLLFALGLNYCGGTEADVVPSALTRKVKTDTRPAPGSDIAFTVFEDDLGKRGLQETRQLFVSAHSYRAYFGHDAPGVDFSRQWVIFYSAGTMPSDGYQARIGAIRYLTRQPTLEVTTALESPGPGCSVSNGQTRPAVLVRFDVPAPRPRTIAYQQEDTLRNCETAQALCKSNEDCRMESDYCTGCDCRAMAPGQTLAACPGPGMNCLVNPCKGRQAMCRAGQCQMMPPARCQSDADCHMERDYCAGCECRAMAQGETLPACAGPANQCLMDPCMNERAVCREGQCAMAAAETQ